MTASPSATINKTTLTQSLAVTGKTLECLDAQDGSSIWVMPHGGRVIGLFGGASDRNFFWTNDALLSGDSARAFFESDAWTNSGGDRTWLAPEVDHFFPDYPDLTYHQPKQLDPGNFHVLRPAETGCCILQDHFELTSARSGRTNSLRLIKTITPAANPLDALARDRSPILRAAPELVEYAGYRLATSIELQNSHSETYEINIWNLLQLPHQGQMFVSTFFRSEPTVFFGEIPAGAIETRDRSIRYTMDADGEQKISVKALACVGRAGYRYPSGELTALVVRNFNVMPSGAYVDAWISNVEDEGYAFQACNINNPTLGQFSELEYHAPAIGGSTGSHRSDDVSEVWAFRGPADRIDEISRLLLSV